MFDGFDYDAWKLAGPPEEICCVKCGDIVPDGELWFRRHAVLCNKCLGLEVEDA